MPISTKSARIGGAVVIALVLVAGGYVLPGLNVPKTKPVNAELTDELLAAYVSKDTDEDGLPDWQETLYGTDSSNPDSDGDGINDGEAVHRGLLTPTALASQLPTDPIGEEDLPGELPTPGSLTDQFSRSFFQKYIEASGGGALSEEAQMRLVSEAFGSFSVQAARALSSTYTFDSVRSSANVNATAYAGSLEQILNRNIPSSDSDILALAIGLIEQNDTSASAKLERLADTYARIATELTQTSAPYALAQSHLSILRSFDEVGKSARALARYSTDPMAAMVALSTLEPSRNAIVREFENVSSAVLREGEPVPGGTAYQFVTFIRTGRLK